MIAWILALEHCCGRVFYVKYNEKWNCGVHMFDIGHAPATILKYILHLLTGSPNSRLIAGDRNLSRLSCRPLRASVWRNVILASFLMLVVSNR